MWSKYVTRRLAVQVAQAWNFGWGRAMEKVYGISVRNTLVFRDSKKTEYYVDARQHKKYVAGLYKLLNDDKFIKTFHGDARLKLENILKSTRRKLKRDLSELSNKELLDVYKNFLLPNVEQFYIRMWTVFNIGEPLVNVVMNSLKKYIPDDNKRREYLLSLSSPLEPNDVLRERIDILKLAIVSKKLSKEEFLKRIKKHTAKYQHIPMFDFDHDPYNKDYFINEIKNAKNPQKELNELRKLFSARKKEFKKILAKLNPDRKFKNLLQFLKENVFLRDYRDMIRQKLNLGLREFYKEAGKRIGLSVEQAAVLTNEEIIKYLSAGKKFPKDEIRRREKAYLLIQKGSRAEIYSGVRAIIKSEKELNISKLKRFKEIKGVVGSSGKAKGPVKIIYTNKDLAKIKKGDVLVTAMTRQDFITAVRRAAALVTDEGSVTAHAAIIARELKIPCIVATKIATKVLRDGDLVEVDATEGTVKVLAKKSI